MTYAPTHTRFNFPHVVSGASKRFIEEQDIAEDFATVIIPDPYEPSEDFESGVDEDWIDPTDDVDGDLPMESDEPDYCQYCDGECIDDGEYYYDPYDRSYFDDEDPSCRNGCDDVNAPHMRCDEHGNVYNRHHEEIDDRISKLIEEHGYSNCVYRCAIMQDVYCGFHGHLFDSSVHVDEDYHRECSEHDHLDDVEYVFNPNHFEENPEAAEHDIVEAYTEWELTFERFYADRCRQYDQKEVVRNRYLTDSSERVTRREGSVKLRGRFDSDRYDDGYIKMKYAYVE